MDNDLYRGHDCHSPIHISSAPHTPDDVGTTADINSMHAISMLYNTASIISLTATASTQRVGRRGSGSLSIHQTGNDNVQTTHKCSYQEVQRKYC